MQRVCSHFTRKIVAQFGAQSISTVLSIPRLNCTFFFFIEINSKVFERSSKTGHNVVSIMNFG